MRISFPRWSRSWPVLVGLVSLLVVFTLSRGRLTTYRSSLGLGPPDASAQDHASLERARRYLERGQPGRTVRALSGITPGSPLEAEARELEGSALAALEEVGPARQSLERAWQLRPTATTARILAAIYLASYENERGLQMLIEASRIEPGDYRPWYAMGQGVYLRLRRHDLAVDAFRKALDRAPEHLESRIGLVRALLLGHRAEEALPTLESLRADRPDDPDVLRLEAESALELGRVEDASASLGRLLASRPDDREGLILLARVQLQRGRPREALAAAERASAQDPNDLMTLTLMSTAQAALGLGQEAAETVSRRRRVQQRAERLESLSAEILKAPGDPAPRLRLGELARETGLQAMAIQAFQGALAAAPDCEEARKALLELGFPESRLPPPAKTRAGGTTGRRIEPSSPEQLGVRIQH